MPRGHSLLEDLFPYVTPTPWPASFIDTDWVTALQEIDNWLERCIGPELVRWRWTGLQCHIGFVYDKDRSLFMLKWS